MPKIEFDEVDRTETGTRNAVDYTVFIPGGSSKEDLDPNFEGLFASKDDLVETVGENSSMGFKIACELLDIGMRVYYRVYDTSRAAEILGSRSFWKPYEDKSVYDIRFICAGLSPVTNTEAFKLVNEKMAEVAYNRGDAIALIDVPQSYSYINEDEETVSFDTWSEESVDTYLNKVLDLGVWGKHCASFSPGVELTKIKSAGTTEFYPGSFAYLLCFAKYSHMYEPWFAYAGAIRGSIPLGVDLPVKFGDADINVLQNRTTAGHVAGNVVCPINPYGNLIWGNRTMFKNEASEKGSVGLKASSFLNIRMLCCDIKKTLYKACRKFTFEPNSSILWTKFCNAITPLLERMKDGQGIKGYKIMQKAGKNHMDHEGEKATLVAVIRIIPIEAVEDFYITVDLSDSIDVSEM